jgi:hypothetical protein
MLRWQARFMARFLEAAAERAEWVSVVEEGEKGTLVIIAADERDRTARLAITTKLPFTLSYTDEWGLLGEE